MNIEDVLKLVNAGYTRAEIDQMTHASGNDPGHVSDPEPGSDPVHVSDPEPGNDPVHVSDPEPGNDQELAQLRQELTQTQTQLKELVKQMQSNNLKTASVNILPDDDLAKKTDAALAELIRPTIKKED